MPIPLFARSSVIAVAVLLVSASVLSAQPPPRRVPAKAKVNTPREAKADRNNDGVVGPKEATAARQNYIENKSAVNTPLEARVDTDNDGVVEHAEIRRFSKAVVDVNNDGIVSAAERTAFWSTRRYRVVKVYAIYDTDSDGYLTGDEIEAAACGRMRLVHERTTIPALTELDREFDTDDNGKIDHAEAQVAVEALCD